MKNILHIIGTRPQIIKLASVLSCESNNFKNFVIDTNQHYDSSMQKNIYNDFGINTDSIIFLDNKKYLSNNVSAITNLLSKRINEIKPNLILVYGDTYTTVAGALSAKIHQIPVVHIEAGLRSFTGQQIEETNRIIVDNVSDYLFCPTLSSVKNLSNEGLGQKAEFIGDIMLDIFIKTKPKKPESLSIDFFNETYYLSTIHRSENLQDENKLKNIIKSFESLPKILLPIHHSLKKKLIEYDLLNSLPASIHLVNPMKYTETLFAIQNSSAVITDSGGLQKDAFWMNKPIVTLRGSTEWIETVELGQNKLINKFPLNLLDIINEIKDDGSDRFSFYGKGNAVLNMMSKIEKII